MSLTENQLLGYLAFKIADARFSRPLSELETPDLEAVVEQARCQYELEEKVLSAPESRYIAIPDATVDDAWLRVKARYDSDREFDSALEQLDMSPESYRQALARELRIDAVLDKVAEDAARVSDDEALAFYHRHSDKFTIPEKRQARHILITVEDDWGQAGELKALREMDRILAEMDEDGSNFGELALRYSQCPTAVEGGQLGKVPPGLLYEELEPVLFRMAEGSVSQPLRSPLGYHLFLCERVIPAEHKSFAQARDKIIEFLADTRRSRAQRQWIKQL